MLLAKRTKPPYRWSLPGGSNEFGESLASTAIREAREEISVEIEILGQAGEREVIIPAAPGFPARRYVIAVFAARLVSGEPATGAEASETGWFAPEEIAQLETTEGLAEAVEQARRLL